MKTLLLTALTFTGIALCAPQAEARDRHDSHSRSYHGSSRYSHGYRSSYHGDHYGYSRGYYYRPSTRYYYRPSTRYYSSDYCEPRRHYSRSPLISFLFGF